MVPCEHEGQSANRKRSGGPLLNAIIVVSLAALHRKINGGVSNEGGREDVTTQSFSWRSEESQKGLFD